jgi:exodeoxyribonuclease X
MSEVYILDCETNTKKLPREPIEVAFLKIESDPDLLGYTDTIPPLTKVTSFHQRFKPDVPSTYGAMAVHHILPEELEGCPPSSSFKLPDGAEYIIGHSIDFDWEAIGAPPVKRICTFAMSQWVWPQATEHSQVALIYMLQGATPATRNQVRLAHGALADCCMNMALLNYILLQKPEIKTWLQLWEYSEKCRVPRTCPMKRWDGLLLEEMDDGAIRWCLNQDWLDKYLRIGLERVMAERYPAMRHAEEFDEGVPY